MAVPQATETRIRPQADQLARLKAENLALRDLLERGMEAAPGGEREALSALQAENLALREQLRRTQRLASIGTMAAMIAHEFNNILTPIVNYAQMARRNPKLVDKAIARAAEGGERATNICHAILGIARQESPEPVEVNISELISETLAAMARDPRRDAIELLLQAPTDMTVVTRRVELQQVLLNLILNARAAVLARQGPRRIEIAAEREGRSVVIHLRDNGVGIPPENLDRIFEAFFTTRTSSEHGPQGTGLGLAICREIVRDMGAEISVQSTPGEGSTFTLKIPAKLRD